MRKRILSLLPYLCMTATMFPTVALAAPDPSAIRLDAANSFGIAGGGSNWVYYGKYSGLSVMWRVLAATGGNGGTYKDNNGDFVDSSGALLLLSGYLLDEGSVIFDSSGNSFWPGSDAQTWCGNFYNNNFNTAEQSAIAATTKSDSSFGSTHWNILLKSSAGILSSDKVFFLSAEEAETSSYGFSTDSDRIAKVGSSAGSVK